MKAKCRGDSLPGPPGAYRRFRATTHPYREADEDLFCFWLDLNNFELWVRVLYPGTSNRELIVRYPAYSPVWELYRTCPDWNIILDWLMEDADRTGNPDRLRLKADIEKYVVNGDWS